MAGLDYSADVEVIDVVVPGATQVITINVPGAQGTQGVQGIQGIQGIQGATGATGPANTLTIGTVATGATGSSAVATITGTAPNQTLNLTIPAGPQGPAGAGSPDATTSVKGSIQLAGDLGGTAAAPTVPGLANKVDTGDTRLTNARTPTAHATTHATGGTDVLTPAAIGAAATSHTHTAANISDSTTVGRSVLTAVDAASARTAIGAGTGTSNLAIGTTSTTAKAGDYQPTAANISDATTIGRTVLTSVDATAVRTAIGAGTSSLTIGTTSTTAKAGDYQPTSANITDATNIATANTVVKRDASGNAAFGTVTLSNQPSVVGDATRKDYVDGQVATRAAAVHSHGVSDLTATGTKDNTTFLRGDGTWAAPVASNLNNLVISSTAPASPTSGLVWIDTSAAGAAADTTAPSVPTGLTATPGNAQVSLSWNSSSDAVGVTGYKVRRAGVVIASPTATSYVDTGRTNGTSYSYTVSAVDAAGNESAQTTAATATPVAPADTTAPTVPTLTTSAASPTSVNLSWTTSTDAVGVASYRIRRGGADLAGATALTGTSFTDSTVSASTQYSYTVSAVDAAGNRSAESTASVVTTPSVPDTTAPTVPVLTATAASPTSVNLSWTTATDAVGVASYRIRRGGADLSGATALTGTSFTDSTAAPSTAYSYTVSAVDGAGNRSAESTAATATTPAAADTTAPTVPTGLTATPGNAQVSLSWSASTDAVGVTGYKVYRGGTLIASPTATSYVDTGVTNGTTYSYAVSARDAAGNESTQTAAVTATPAAAQSSIFPATNKMWEFVAADAAAANNATVLTLPERLGGAALVAGGGIAGHTSTPTYRTALHTNPVLEFDTSGDFMDANLGITAQPTTRFFIGRFVTAGNSAPLLTSLVAGGNRNALAQAATGGKFNAYSGTNLPHTATTDTALHFFAVVYNGASSSITVDGVAVTGNAGTESANGLRINSLTSAASTLPTAFGAMLFGEAAAYDKAMTTAEIASVRTAAKAKWTDLP